MEPDFWLERWRQNLIGFHQQEINPHLQSCWEHLSTQPGAEVLVPLCGKSRDMSWISERGYRVLGIELSEVAVQDFFRDRGETPGQHREGRFTRYSSGQLALLCGDFFDLQRDQLREVRAVYDRAALIALPPPMRVRYADKLTDSLPAGAEILLVTLEYPQAQMSGPPFAVPEQEVRELFERRWSVELLHEQDILADEPRFRERGLSDLTEKVYRLRRRSP